MELEIIECIPSLALRNYLKTHHVNLSVMQQATIVSEYAKKKKQITLFGKLKEIADSYEEKLLLDTAIMELKENSDSKGEDLKETCEVYRKFFPHKGFPVYPFLEFCKLPVLFKTGDVIRCCVPYYGNELFCVGFGPVFEAGIDFSDECYMCYSISYPVKEQNDLALSHAHINVCDADSASTDRLTRKQKKNLRRIRELITSDDYELKRFL